MPLCHLRLLIFSDACSDRKRSEFKTWRDYIICQPDYNIESNSMQVGIVKMKQKMFQLGPKSAEMGGNVDNLTFFSLESA